MHVVITGSTRGIGLGMAREFLERDWLVTINGTTDSSVEKAVSILKKDFPEGKFIGYAADVAKIDEMKHLLQEAHKYFGKVDVWINNAGIDQEREDFWDLQYNEMMRVVDINIKGVMNGSRVATQYMHDHGEGYVYNMEGYGSAGMMQPGLTVYGMTKRAVSYFTESLAKEVAHTSIKVGRLSPGMVLTTFLLDQMPTDQAEAKRLKRVYNILADEVSVVSKFLVEGIIKNKKNNAHIQWLTKRKSTYRFLMAPFNKRDIVDKVIDELNKQEEYVEVED